MIKIKCTCCGKRAFDISELPKQSLEVDLKCPHCKNIVRIPCTIKNVLPEKITIKYA
ncbi:MAG: hypothetical protein Q4G11_05265 [Gallicola sp.]|nr:hypothetical protein [Gallicola sp.]